MFSTVASSITPPRRIARYGAVIAIATAALAGALAAPAAQAAGTCPTYALSQPFSKWGDSNYYTLVTEGNFEGSLAAWKLEGATKVAGGETYGVGGSVSKYSLLLAAGNVARSPFMCVTEVDRRFRFFVKAEATSGTIDVELVYKTSTGTVAGGDQTVNANGTWQPSAALYTGAAKAVTNGTAQLAFRFKGDAGKVRISDVYLDPRMH
jgi:hypothetical protein